MAWQKDHKTASRIRILEAAARLFNRLGFNQVGIDAVMQAAGMTRGAFYAHFSSKTELYEESMQYAAMQAGQRLVAGDLSQAEFVDAYLSLEHKNTEAIHCPLACLVSDVAHSDVQVRETYTKLLKNFIVYFSNLAEGNTVENPPADTTIQQAVLLIGGMALARSVTDEALAEQILAICRSSAKNISV